MHRLREKSELEALSGICRILSLAETPSNPNDLDKCGSLHFVRWPTPEYLFSMLRTAPRVHSAGSIRATRHLTATRWSSDVSNAPKHHDPLRILFCGADEFSIYSLRALHELQRTKPDAVESIDVVCRPDKRVGRGLKQIQEGEKPCIAPIIRTCVDSIQSRSKA